jgi:hypothetical protein
MFIDRNNLFYNCDKKIFNCTLNDPNINYIDVYDLENISINNSNKYCVYYSLYDIHNTSQKNGNLYYYKGIINTLSIDDRDFDVHIDITKSCYDILQNIILDNKYLNLNNVSFNIRNEPKTIEGSIWRLQSAINNYDKYDTILICDSDLYIKNKFFDIDFKKDVSIYTITDKINGNYQFVWGQSLVPCGNLYCRFKNFKTDIKKIKYIIDKILNSNIQVHFNFDELLLNHLFYKDILYSYMNMCISDINLNLYYNDIIMYIHPKDVKKYNDLKYLIKEQIYFINDKEYHITELKPEYIKKLQYASSLNEYNNNIQKYTFLTIDKYLNGIINNFDVIGYE